MEKEDIKESKSKKASKAEKKNKQMKEEISENQNLASEIESQDKNKIANEQQSKNEENKESKSQEKAQDDNEQISYYETEKRPNTDLLQSAYTNIQSGLKGIEYLLPESQSMEFSSFLAAQQKRYKELYLKAEELARKHELKLKQNSWFKNAKMWISIKMGSFGVEDSQRLSELMIMGNFFGCIDMIKALADSKDAMPQLTNLARQVKTLEEDCINGLIPYLERTKK